MPYIQVFEHSVLSVGTRQETGVFELCHLEQMAQFSKNPYFKVQNHSVVFRQYVGALQVGGLTIEILPKADIGKNEETGRWQRILLELLQACSFIQPHLLGHATLKLQPNTILDWFVAQFLLQVEALLRNGLVKKYRRQQEQLPVLKGQLNITTQIRQNGIHAERFICSYDRYSFSHPLNQIVWQALDLLQYLNLSPNIKHQLTHLYRQFPKLDPLPERKINFGRITYDRKTAPYKSVIEWAQIFIQQLQPQITAGQESLLAILFDMNVLFEAYIYQQLKEVRNADWLIRKQVQRPFWNRRYIRPDLVLQHRNGESCVIDTKWKVILEAKPGMEDLRQLYVYNQYFRAKWGILLYPQVNGLKNTARIPFSPSKEGEELTYGQVLFAEIIKEGKLNRKLGEELLAQMERDHGDFANHHDLGEN